MPRWQHLSAARSLCLSQWKIMHIILLHNHNMALKLIYIRIRMQCMHIMAAGEWSPAKLPLKMTSMNGDDVRCELYILE